MKLSSARITVVTTALFFCANTIVAQKPATQNKTIQQTVAVATPVKTASGYGNGIKLKVKGLAVKEAFLVFEDGTLVPAGNKIAIDQRVSLRIILSKGFKEVDGKVFPGGSEKIVLSTGEVVLESADLFTDFDSVGVSPVDAKFIILKAVISEIKDKKNSVIVSFKVWDKKSEENVITGSYILHIK